MLLMVFKSCIGSERFKEGGKEGETIGIFITWVQRLIAFAVNLKVKVLEQFISQSLTTNYTDSDESVALNPVSNMP